MTCSLFYADLGRKERRKEAEIPEVVLRKIHLALGEVVGASCSSGS